MALLFTLVHGEAPCWNIATNVEHSVEVLMQCFQEKKTVQDCVQRMALYDVQCADCALGFGQCVFDGCPHEHTGQFMSCILDCLPKAEHCFEEDKIAQLRAPLAEGKCTDAQDMSHMKDAETYIENCAKETTDEAGFVSCMEADGFTAGCAECIGTYLQCVIKDCPHE